MNNQKKLESLIAKSLNDFAYMKVSDLAEFLDKHNVIVLPCAIGSEVWIVSKNSAEPYPAKFKLDDLSQIGRRIFLTRESALKYMRREKRQ